MSRWNEAKSAIESALTIRELIEQLSEFEDQDSRVMFVCNYGDYGRTQQALPVGEIEVHTTRDIVSSAYSQSGAALETRDEYQEVYCDDCEQEFSFTAKCPKCGGRTVGEDGELIPTNSDDDGESLDVIILQS